MPRATMKPMASTACSFRARLVSSLRLPLPIPIHLVVKPDWRLIFYCAIVAILSALISGLMPALTAVRKDVNDALKSSQHQTERSWGLRSLLVAGQLAVSIVLLATGFLFIHNLLRATSMNPGFDPKHAIWAYMRLVPERYKDQTKERALVELALDRGDVTSICAGQVLADRRVAQPGFAGD